MSSPPPLAELQRWLRWAITDPRGIDGALAGGSGPSRPEPGPRLLGWVASGSGEGPRGRLAVYADAYFARLLEALEANYPAVRRSLGAAAFRGLAADYLLSRPSRSPTLEAFAEGLADFAAGHGLARTVPFLADLARLEAAVLGCVYAVRLPPFDPSPLERAGEEGRARARLVLDPTVRLLETDWPVERLWRERGRPEAEGPRSLPRRSRRRLLVWRADGWAEARALGPGEALALRSAAEGLCLGELCERLEEFGASPEDLRGWFGRWAASGVLKKAELPPVGPAFR